MDKSQSRSLFWTLNILFLIEWVFLAFNVDDRKTWMLENGLAAVFIGPILYYYIKGVFSKTSYLLIFLFLIVHTLGAHYTYGEVPYDQWTEAAFGTSLNEMLDWKRNHYDRLVHFLFGFVAVLPIIEIFAARSPLRGRWLISYVLLLLVTASTAYELIEWTAAEIFGSEQGAAYLGSQGDEWDAQKDITFATLGSFLGLIFLRFRKK